MACGIEAWGAEAPSARTSRSAVMQSPARDGAYVLELPGLVNSEKHTTISGMKKTIDDGIVIRKSRIKSDGTIVIPRRASTPQCAAATGSRSTTKKSTSVPLPSIISISVPPHRAAEPGIPAWRSEAHESQQDARLGTFRHFHEYLYDAGSIWRDVQAG